MRFKPTYRYRITDNVYIVYKLSNYSREPLREIEAGIAFDRRGEYSRDFLKVKKKYNLASIQDSVGSVSNSHKDFCVSLYNNHFLSKKKPLPSNVAATCRFHWLRRMEELTEEVKKIKEDGKIT